MADHVFEVQLTFAVEAENADQAAEAFGDWLGMSKAVEVLVRNVDNGGAAEPVVVEL